MRHTCPPTSLCSWWGTRTLSWCFPCLRCSRSQGGAAWTGWGSRRPGPGCFGPREANRSCSARPRTGSGRPGWWARQTRAVARASLSSSASKEENMSHQLMPKRSRPSCALMTKTQGKQRLTLGVDFSILLDGSSGRVLAKYVGCGCTPTGNPGLMMDPVWNTPHHKLRLITPHKNRLPLIYYLTNKYKKKKQKNNTYL